MSTQKFLREIKRAAARKGFKVAEIKQKNTTHFAITFTAGDVTLPAVTASCSPTNLDHAVKAVMRDVQALASKP